MRAPPVRPLCADDTAGRGRSCWRLALGLCLASCVAAPGTEQARQSCPYAPGAQPPAWVGPPDTSPPLGATAVFAMTELFLGDTSLYGSPDSSAWQTYGFDLDGLTSVGHSPCECTPYGALDTQRDGLAGIDNTFGPQVLSLWLGLDPSATQKNDAALLAGDVNVLFEVEGLRTPAPASYPLAARVFAAAPLGSSPAFDGSDVFPFDWTEVQGRFATAYVAGDVAVLRGATVPVPVHIWGDRVVLHVRNATVTLELDESREEVTLGMMGGVLDVDELVDILYRTSSGSFCTDGKVESLANTLRACADTRTDGRGGAELPCNGVSVGVAFRGARVVLGAPATPPPPVAGCWATGGSGGSDTPGAAGSGAGGAGGG
ncbi:MAG: hypothetical protein IT373_37230 [Polyangiaceae bacterium]|nr:hypothetical protein [Polyangiaceae bacterium]